MSSYYKYKGFSKIYNEIDLTNLELNHEYNYNSLIEPNDKIQKYLKEIMLFHIGNNEKNDNKITYSRLNYEELLDMTINNTQDTNSIIVNLSNQPLTIITVDMDADQYMFKECSLETKINIIILEPNSHIFFDNLTVYGFINYDFIKNDFINSGLNNSNIYLKIDIPKELVKLNKTSHDDTPWLEYNEKSYIEQYNNTLEIIENIIYDTNKSNIISIINSKNNNNALIINLNFIFDIEVSNKENLYKYGEIYNEIIKLKNGQQNKFNTNKLVLHALPSLICDWIDYECKYIDNWIELKYDNFDRICTIEKIPNILQFCLFATLTHIQYFKQLYNIPDNLPINIIDMFICKNNQSQSKHTSNTEQTYIVLNYKLTTDNGYIKFLDTNDEIMQSQGDLIIYTSKKEQHKYESNDTWYSLIVLLDIINIDSNK
jgi:hypothetical protein